MLVSLALAFLLANAVFWGLACHKTHCALVAAISPSIPCPSHWVHLAMGVGFYVASVVLAQRKFLFRAT